MDTSFIEGVGALIYCTETKRYLFLLRNQSKHSGSWGLVGGKVDPGETVLEALYREMQEELGGIIRDPKLIPIEKFTSDNENFVYHTFLIPVEHEFIPDLNHEHRGYCWVPLKDFPKPLHPGVWRTFNFKSILNKIKTVEQVIDQPLEQIV